MKNKYLSLEFALKDNDTMAVDYTVNCLGDPIRMPYLHCSANDEFNAFICHYIFLREESQILIVV